MLLFGLLVLRQRRVQSSSDDGGDSGDVSVKMRNRVVRVAENIVLCKFAEMRCLISLRIFAPRTLRGTHAFRPERNTTYAPGGGTFARQTYYTPFFVRELKIVTWAPGAKAKSTLDLKEVKIRRPLDMIYSKAEGHGRNRYSLRFRSAERCPRHKRRQRRQRRQCQDLR